MQKKDIAKQYITHLEKGDIAQVIALFSTDGMVESPIYGIKTASDFYNTLSSDTFNSELFVKGIFEDKDTGHLALYFTYKWTLKNQKLVEFDVVDIIEFDDHNKISKLKIIYDTVVARRQVDEL